MLKEALEYLNRGLSVFPLHIRSKIPAIEWAKYQKERPSEDQVREWFAIDRNIAIATGNVSGLVVIDVDCNKGGNAQLYLDKFPTKMIAKTGKGYHLYYQYPGFHVDNRIGIYPGVDVRGDGGYVVAPPSIHPDGSVYEWVSGIKP